MTATQMVPSPNPLIWSLRPWLRRLSVCSLALGLGVLGAGCGGGGFVWAATSAWGSEQAQIANNSGSTADRRKDMNAPDWEQPLCSSLVTR